MGLFRKFFIVGIIALLLGGWLLQTASLSYVRAQDAAETETPPEEEKRTTQITVPFTRYKWWLIRWSNDNIVCTVYVEHEGVPTLLEVESQCDPNVYREWSETQPCDVSEVDSFRQCPGFYFQFIESSAGERQIELELPKPEAWVSIIDCNEQFPDTHCTTLPSLLITGEEPLPNEIIISIQGTINNVPFSCMGNECRLPLQPTSMEGIDVEFWVDSSFGDSSKHFTAKVRVVPWGEFMNPEEMSSDPTRYYVDVLSSRWRDGESASCAETWQVFPDIGGPPDWLRSPETAEELESDVAYYYLAGALITYGVVDASTCLDGGLQAPNIASPCGVEVAKPQLIEWQNRFDQDILKASQETGIPARLLKNVFSRESQIWPGIFRTYKEAGLGQLTENGADTILLWNPEFFHQFCPFVLNQVYCDLGYGNLETELQNMLRGALVRKVDASCPDCPASIDLSQASFSINVFAEGLLANCEQVGRMITNETSRSPGQLASYEDLWRFTLVNYNAGPGCLSNAIIDTWNANQQLNWANVTSHLEPVCEAAIGYVEDISRMLRATPTPTIWLPFDQPPPTPELPRVLSSPTPGPSPTPFAGSRTATPGRASTATPDGDDYPAPPTSTPPEDEGYPVGPTETVPTATEISYPGP